MSKAFLAATTHALAWLRDAAAAGLWRAEAARVDGMGNLGGALLGKAAPADIWTASGGGAGYVDGGAATAAMRRLRAEAGRERAPRRTRCR